MSQFRHYKHFTPPESCSFDSIKSSLVVDLLIIKTMSPLIAGSRRQWLARVPLKPFHSLLLSGFLCVAAVQAMCTHIQSETGLHHPGNNTTQRIAQDTKYGHIKHS